MKHEETNTVIITRGNKHGDKQWGHENGDTENGEMNQMYRNTR